METCKYCQKTFKRLASHINKCHVKLSMTPCPHCNKLFKRVSAHVYRCPKKPESKDESKNISSEEEKESVDDGQLSNKTPCPHCQKMFKRVASHVNRCPQKPKEKEEVSDGISPDEDDEVDVQVSDQENGATPGRKSLDEKYSNKKVSNMTPCPHCDKMFKRLATHLNRCPKKREENEEVANEEEDEGVSDNTIENDSSSEEVEEEVAVNRKAGNPKPCPYCQKMFKSVAGHIYRCPQKLKENGGGIQNGKVIEIISSSEEEDEEYEDEEPEDSRENTDNSATRHFYKTVTTTKTTQTVPKTFIDQSEYRTNYFAMPVSNSSPKPLGHESGKNGLMRPSIQSDYLPSPMQKRPTNTNAALGKVTPHRLSHNYETWETDSNSSYQISPGMMQRPPIHGNHSTHDIHIVDVSGNDEESLTDYSEDSSFNRSTGSNDSFSYLNQVLKRPPIHKGKMQREAIKKHQLPTDEEEFFEFHRHVARE